MGNVRYSKYGLGHCWTCLCEVCTRRHCPKNYLYQARLLYHCEKMMQREACPTVKCDWFEHKEKVHVFHVRRRKKPVSAIQDKLDLILKQLENLPTKLR